MANDHWCTPEWLLEIVRTFAEPIGGIYLDPCSNERSTVGAQVSFCGPPIDDGLAARWLSPVQPALVYVNPPYSKPAPWVEKCAREGRATDAAIEVVALLNADTSTRWFHDHIAGGKRHARAIHFLNRRVQFVGDKRGTPPHPQLLAYWGERFDGFRAAFRGHGWTVSLPYTRRS